LYLSASVALVCAAILAFVMIEAPQDQNASAQARSSKAASPALPATAEAATEVHIMAGHSGSDVIDNSGVRWTPDRFYTGGGGWSINRGFVRGTSRPFLFTTSRTGEFSYDIPVGPGSYELRLFFVSPNRVGDEKLASFDVSVNGQPLLPAYDVNISAHGSDVADEKVFRDITPDEDGFVRVRFTNQMAAPWVNALELTPGTPGKLNPIRIITQPTSFVDHKGQRWRADDYYINGFRSTERRKVSGTDDPELFSAERYGHFRYAIPVDPRGRYTVILHFAEFYFGPQLEGGGASAAESSMCSATAKRCSRISISSRRRAACASCRRLSRTSSRPLRERSILRSSLSSTSRPSPESKCWTNLTDASATRSVRRDRIASSRHCGAKDRRCR